jgi:large subunit ribosomal protein L21
MYAIIRAGGKQAKVKAGDVIEIERVKDGSDALTFTPLLVVSDDGKTVSDRSILSDSKVVAEIMGETQGDKIDIFKYKNKTGYRRHMGHRQKYTQIMVTSIDVPGVGKSVRPAASETGKAEAATVTPKPAPTPRPPAAAKAPPTTKASPFKAKPAAKAPATKKVAKPAGLKKAPTKATASTKTKPAAASKAAKPSKKSAKRPTKKS